TGPGRGQSRFSKSSSDCRKDGDGCSELILTVRLPAALSGSCCLGRSLKSWPQGLTLQGLRRDSRLGTG
ncbi:MAG: hypothetical protein ACPGXX_21075, partial [Planctomycetaceae bacterium]